MSGDERAEAGHRVRKAQEYAEEIVRRIGDGEDRTEVFRETCIQMLEEIKEIAEVRHARSDGAIAAIFEEQHRKWMSIVRRLPPAESEDLREDGLMRLTRKALPELWAIMPERVTRLIKGEADE